MWANLPRHVGKLTPMQDKLAHVYLPYKSHNIVKIMGVLYVFLGRNMSRKAEVKFRHKTSNKECEKLPWYLQM